MIQTAEGPKDAVPPWWWAPIQASIYLKGAYTPEFLAHTEEGQEWTEYALMCRSVEAEVWEIEHPDGQSPKAGSQTFIFNHDEDEDG